MKMERIIRGSVKYLEEIENRALGKAPVDFININLPPICNYKCKKCLVGKSSFLKRNYLTLTEIKKLIKNAKALGARVVTFTGEGEPLLIDYFYELLTYINKIGMMALIATNGSLLSRKTVELLVLNKASVLVSLDTLDRQMYNEMTGVDKLDLVLENINYARKRFMQLSTIERGYKLLNFGIHTTITAKNLAEIQRIEEFCGDDMVFSAGTIGEIGSAELNKELIPKQNAYDEAKKRYFLMGRDEEGSSVCAQFYYGVDIGADGKILLDAHALCPEGIIINDIRDYNLKLDDIIVYVKKMKRKLFRRTRVYCPIIRNSVYKEFVSNLLSVKT